ncbi:26267_t:CDS:1, partial [Gigaspora rosea]
DLKNEKKSTIINPPVAHSGKTAEAIFNEIKNKHGEVTHNEILSYMKKQGSSLIFDVKDPDKKYNVRELN